MNKRFPKWILFVAIPCVLAASGYFALIQYYKANIPYGTWVNNIYCTGYTYDEIAETLLSMDKTVVDIEVIDCDGKSHMINPEKEIYSISYEKPLQEAVISLGAAGLFSEKKLQIEPVVSVNREKWDEYVQSLDLFQFDVKQPQPRMTIVKTESGFELKDACKHILDREKASEVLLNAIESGIKQVSLPDTGCYYTPPYDEADKLVIAEFEALEAFCSKISMPLTIQGETAYLVDASVLKDWILQDGDGTYVYGKGGVLLLDEKKVKEYAQYISDEVTTYWGKPWQFVAHDGETIEVKAGNYGRKLKTNNLYKALLNAYQMGTSESYELALDSPCVTGDVRRKRLTPTGTFYIEYKQKNRTLKGEDYNTPVNYWMHFYNHCGFHDAGWRKKFGDEIYLKDGSHGCVNMPPAKAKEMYSLVYKGMPVFVY